MQSIMVIRVAIQSGYGGVRHVLVSLPRIDFLIADQPDKYARPEDDQPPPTRADVQPIGKRRLYGYGPHHNYKPRSAPRVSAAVWRELERSLSEPLA